MAIIAATAIACACAYACVKLPFEGFKKYLNNKDELPADSTENDVKAGVYTAAFLTAALGVVGVGAAYQENLKRKYPSIAVAYSNAGKNYVIKNANSDKAYRFARQYCNQNSGFFTSCNVKMFTKAGQKTCINHGVIIVESTSYDLKRGKSVSEATHPFYSATSYRPKADDQNVEKACIKVSNQEDFSASFCKGTKFTSSCNF